MDVLHHCCCGVEVHKASVVACVIAPSADGAPCKEVRTFGTMTEDLLLRASFIPSREQCELRDLTGTRTSLIGERPAAVNRIQKVLEDATSKMAGVATDFMGKSGRDIWAALLHIDVLDEQIERPSTEIAERLRPYAALLLRLESIPGLGRRTAEILAAEVGLDVVRFPSAGHLASWAGMCPGNEVSAGKCKTGKRRQGKQALWRALTEAARAAARTTKKDQTS